MSLEPVFQQIPHSSPNLVVQWFGSGPGYRAENFFGRVLRLLRIFKTRHPQFEMECGWVGRRVLSPVPCLDAGRSPKEVLDEERFR